MTVICHLGFKKISETIKNNNYANIADFIYFRTHKSHYVDGNNNRYFLLPNIDHIVKNCNVAARTAYRAIKYLCQSGFIQKVRKRCSDCGVRSMYYLTKKYTELMTGIEKSLSVKKLPKQAKKLTQPLFYADSAILASSDSANLASSYIIEDIEKEYNNNTQSKNYNPKADFKNNLTVNFDFRKYGYDSFECEAVVKLHKTNNQLKAIQIIIENNINKINTDTFQNFINNEENQSQASDFRDLVEMAYRHARIETTETQKPVNADIEEPKQDFDLEDIALRIIDNHPTADLESVKNKLLKLNTKYDFDSEKDLVSATICELEIITEDEYLDNVITGLDNEDLGDISEDTETIVDQPKPLKITSTTQLPEYLEVISESDVCESTAPTKELITMHKLNKANLLRNLKNEADQSRYNGTLPYSQCKALVGVIDYVQRECGVIIGCENEVYKWLYFMASNPQYHYTKAKNFEHFCNIAMAQLKARRLNKPLGFGKWLSFVEDNSRKAA